jgi:hypothetical protein
VPNFSAGDGEGGGGGGGGSDAGSAVVAQLLEKIRSGNFDGAADLISPKAKGRAAQMRDGEVSETGLKTLQAAIKDGQLQAMQTVRGAHSVTLVKPNRGGRVQFKLDKTEDGKFMVTEIIVSAR